MASTFLSKNNQRKRVIIAVPSLGIGGQERIAINTASCLRDDYEVKIVVFQKKEEEYSASVPVINLDCPAKKNLFGKVISQLLRACKLRKIRIDENIDIVYSLGATANLTNVLSSIACKGKTIISIHGFAEVKKNRVNDFLFRKTNKTVCISKEMQYQLLKLYPDLSNTIVIENGYDIEKITREKEGTKRQPSLPRVVAMGRLDPVKRYDVLIRALALVISKNPDINLSFIGKGKERQSLQKLCEELGIQKNVEFLGFRKNPFQVLKENDIFALTSANEGFPNSIIEALACGLAVVSVDCLSGPREILSDNYSVNPISGIVYERYGILVENNANQRDLVLLFSEALYALINSHEMLNMYRTRGEQRAREFSIDVYKRKLYSLLET